MHKQTAVSVSTAVVFFWLALAPQTVAQSKTPHWSTKQVAGEYLCRPTRAMEHEAKEDGLAPELEWPANTWPKELVLLPDGTWHANGEAGDFSLKGVYDHDLQLKGATWAEYGRAEMVTDRKGTVAIAVYFSSWCANDSYVHLKRICERKGQTFDEEAALVAPSIPDLDRMPNYNFFPHKY